ncbi:hypothetical protein BU14_1895s0001, partial [Porphyra umbilicalis]
MVRCGHDAGPAVTCAALAAAADGRVGGARSRDFAAGTTTPKYGPSLELEPTHLLLQLRIDIADRTAGGAVTTTVVARCDGARGLSLHAEDFADVSAVTLVTDGDGDGDGGGASSNGGPPADLSWTYDGHVIAVRLGGDGLAAGATARIRVAYSVSSPISGMFFSDPGRTPFVATDHETERARYWLPCVDHPAVRTSLRFELTLREGLTVLANGARLDGGAAGDVAAAPPGWTTTVWALTPPHRCPSYLLCIAAGDFVRADGGSYTDGGGVGREIAFFGPADATTADDLARTFGPTRSMIAWMTRRLGVAFPWPKYFQYAVGGGVGGAMENISLVSWHDTCVLDAGLHAERGFLIDMVNVHEMAHTFFGDLLVIAHFDDAWLKESWANYMELVYMADTHGADVAQAFWHQERLDYTGEVDDAYARPLSTRTFDCSWSMFDRHLYPGGAWRLHMLTTLVGPRPFWAAITAYLSAHAHGTVETVDLRRALEAATGRNLVRWFDQWVYMAGYPKLTATTSWNAATGVAAVTLRQTQADPSRRIGTFDLSVPVAVQAPSGEWLDAPPVVMTAEAPSGTTMVRLPGAPTAVVIDPHAVVLHTLDWSAAGEDLLARALATAPTAAGRVQAGVELGKRGTSRSIAALSAALRDEPCWAVRRQLAAVLPAATSVAAAAGLVAALDAETDARVVYVLVDALGKARGDAAAVAALTRVLATGTAGPLATAAALRGIGAQRSSAHVPALARWVGGTPPAPAGWSPASVGIAVRGALTGLGATRAADGLSALLGALDVDAADAGHPLRWLWVRAAAVAAAADAVAWADRPTRARVAEALVGIARRDGASSVRVAACRALVRLGGDAVEAGLPAVLTAVAGGLPNQDAVAVRRAAAEAGRAAVTVGEGEMPPAAAAAKEAEEAKEAVRA